ncbi:UNVERIFIED_CONTAM: hypothetical protein PYX00_007021 [Menopon gallinae]|uniref:Translation initiation factor eIF2B subunit delta n=1 Tax=Menopon gallinae TaxID=328185 RepID=A0AAW2HHJ4_9NEOP
MADKEDISTHKKSKRKSKGQKDTKDAGDQGGVSKSIESAKVSETPKDVSMSVSKPIENPEEKGDQDVNKKSSKSREEILAEREAKKLAKQALKKKAKEAHVDKANNLPQDKNEEAVKKEDKENVVKKDSTVKPMETKIEVSKILEEREPEKENIDGKDKNEGKSKAQLRAERRALQEAQRARKLEKAKEVIEEKTNVVTEVPKTEKISKFNKVVPVSEDKVHKVKLFAHLYRPVFDCVEMDLSEEIHPSIVRLGTQYRSKVISGANAKCLALLNAFKTVLADYKTPTNQEFSRGLEAEISKSMVFLNKCRPVAVSMVNAVKHLRFQVNQLKGNEIESKKQINDWIDTYIKEQIEKAAEAISLFVLQKITDGDVILTYSCSSLIQRILLKASEEKIKFRVIVVDGRPWLEGKEMLRRLVKAGISCTYVFFNGLSFIMPEVTKILLGAHALLANGYVMSRAGSSQVALLAKAYNVPVLVCCETHKFSEKVQTDSFVHNELGDPDQLISNKGAKELSKWRTIQYLTPLNLTYDVTPPDLVSAVVTEIAVLPCTSVPVILRVKPPDLTC